MASSPTLQYPSRPQRARAGLVGDQNPARIDSFVLKAGETANPGAVLLQVPQGASASSNFPKIAERARTVGTRPIAGFAVYEASLPQSPYREAFYLEKESVGVVRQGRVWVPVENFAGVDPVAAADTWFVRNAGASAGALRYGDDDGGTCTAITTGKIRAIDRETVGATTLVYVECNFGV